MAVPGFGTRGRYRVPPQGPGSYQAPAGDWWSQNAPGAQANPAGFDANDPRYQTQAAMSQGYGTTAPGTSQGGAGSVLRDPQGNVLQPGWATTPTGREAVTPGAGAPWTFTGTPTLQDLERYFWSRGVPTTEAPYWLQQWPELVARGQQIGDPGYAMRRLSQAEIFAGTPYDVGRAPGSAGGAGPSGGGPGGHGGGMPGGAEWGAAGYGSFTSPPPAFVAPTGVTMANDPGYQFRLEEGRKALQGAAAARGSILSGGTLKALDRYNQEYASGEFGNVYNRALTGYVTNVGVQRGAQQDYWGRLRDLYSGGLSATSQTYQRPPGY